MLKKSLKFLLLFPGTVVFAVKPSNGWYATVDMETGEIGGKVRYDQTLEHEFWEPVFANTDFKEFVKKQYSIGHKEQVSMDEIVIEDV
jgi:hypothetical protein